MQGADAAGADALDQRFEQLQTARDLDVLDDDAGVHEIEIATDGRERVVGHHELSVADAVQFAVAARLGQHRRRDVHTHHLGGDGGQRHQHAADSAAEVQHPLWREAAVQVAAANGHHMADMQPAEREELQPRFFVERVCAELGVSQNAEVGVLRSPLLPFAVGCHWRGGIA